MDKVDILRKHIGNDDFYDINGTPLLTKILAAMDDYTQHQVKNCSIPAVVGRSEQLPPNPITDKEHKDLMKALYPKDKSKRFRG